MRAREAPAEPWRLGVLTTHPIQYHTPWFQAMHAHSAIDLEVLYAHRASKDDQAKAGFGVEFEWDIPLLEGYRSCFLENRAKRPGLGFSGIDLPDIGQVLERGGFDAILIHGWHFKGAWQALRACRRQQIPAMVRSDSQLGGRRLAKQMIKWLPYRFFIPRLDACLCVGERSHEYFRYYGASPEKIFRVPHVLGNRWFATSDESQKIAQRRKYGIPEEAFVPLFVGKLLDKKRPLDFLKACAQLDKDRVCAVLVGEGDLRSVCARFARQNGLRSKLIGFVNQAEMPSAYAMGDVLCLPSDASETWGLVVNEAMAGGLPCIVSSAVGSAPDLVIEGNTGSVFPEQDIRAFSASLKNLMDNQDLLKEMGENARLQAESFRPGVAVEGVLDALQSFRFPRRIRS